MSINPYLYYRIKESIKKRDRSIVGVDRKNRQILDEKKKLQARVASMEKERKMNKTDSEEQERPIKISLREWGFNGTVPPGLKLVITPFESYLTPSNEALSNEVKNESN